MKRIYTSLLVTLVLLTTSLQFTSAASFSDLSSYQIQKYWSMMSNDCIPLLSAQKYTDYRTCALNTLDKASKLVEAQESWCSDSDGGVDFMKKGTVKTDLNPNGIDDYVYTWGNASYVIEGTCSGSKQYMMYFKNCSELGTKYVADVAAGACVLKNSAPMIEVIDDKTVKEGEELKFEVKASDVDGDAIAYSVKDLPIGATFVGQTFTWTPNYKQAGNYAVTFIVNDGKLESSQIVNIQVNDAIPPCVKPKDGMKIIEDTYFCPGSYLITAPFSFDADNANLNCQGATLYGNGLAQPIIVKNRKNIGITNCKFEKFADGIKFDSVVNSKISDSFFTGIGDPTTDSRPIILLNSSNNMISNNKILNAGSGIFLDGSTNNIVTNNEISALGLQWDGTYSGTGLQIYGSSINTIEGNNFSLNGAAISLWWGDSKNGNENTIRDNTFTKNQMAISIYGKNNKVYRNNFINNGGTQGWPADQQVVVPVPSYENIFTVNGQGNYWSSYDEAPEGCVDNDANGICDNAFNKIALNNYDFSPYLKPNGWKK